jgi:hypothetical protein
VVETNNDEAGEIMLILNVWSVETPKYLHSCKEYSRATQGMTTSRRAQVYSAQGPGSTWQGHQARTPQGGLHSRRKIPGVQNRLAGLQEHNNLGRSCIQGTQLGWQSCIHTEVLQYLGIKAR